MPWAVPRLWVVVYTSEGEEGGARQLLVYAMNDDDYEVVALVLGQWFLALESEN